MDDTNVYMDKRQKLLIVLLILFFIVYEICTVLMQIRSGLPPWKGGSPIDQLTGSMLWVSSIMALLIATQRNHEPVIFLIWLCVTAAAAALAIDEVFEFHEYTKASLGDDDYVKIAIWFIAGTGLFILYHIEKPVTKIVMTAFIIGFIFQTLYLIDDMGDGDYFLLPLSKNVSGWAEDIMELLFVQSYLSGLIFHFITLNKNNGNNQT